MPDSDDITLLKQYAEGDDSAFAVLIGRYVQLVYSTALRRAGNPSHAEEITQAVFIILTRKAKSLGPKTILSGWLYQTARLTAANFLRSEFRRQQREQEAYMQSTLTETDTSSWEHIAPLLEEAMGRLGETDRNAIVLRFFENKTPQEVATKLRLNEVAERKRVSRALEKLRKFFMKRGFTLPVAVLTTAISANSVHAAPAGLAATISATTAKGAAVTTTITTLAKGTLKIMAYTKLKLALYIGAAIVLAGGVTTTALLSSGPADDKIPAAEIFKNAQDKYASLTSYSDEGQTVATVGGMTLTTTFTVKLARPDRYRIEWEQPVLLNYNNKGIVWSAGNGDFLVIRDGAVQKQKNRDSALGSATGISGSAAATIPGTFFKINGGDQLGRSLAGEKRLADEKVGDVDCYVFTSEVKKGLTRTLWIGKQDYLIHQVRNVTSAAAMKAVMADVAKKNHSVNIPLPDPQDITSIETHTKIVVNPDLSAADFAR